MFNKLSNCRLAANHQRKTKSEQNPKAPSSNGMIHHWEPWRRNAPNCNCSLSMQLLEVESHLTAYDMMHAFNIVKLGTSSSNLSMRLPLMEPLSWVHPIDWFMKEKLQNLIFGWSDGMHVFGSFWSPCIVCCKLNLAAMIWGTMLLDTLFPLAGCTSLVGYCMKLIDSITKEKAMPSSTARITNVCTCSTLEPFRCRQL